MSTLVVMIVCLSSCNNYQYESKTDYSFSEVEYPQDYIRIGNKIPEWLTTSEPNKTPIYAVTAKDMQGFDAKAKDSFSHIYDDMWTQEQSDNMYLGQGINVFPLDDTGFTCAYYPIIYNGYIVSMLLIIRDSENDYRCQLAPYYSNEFNALAQNTSESTPLYLGIAKNNLICIIGKEVFILTEDYIEHKKVDLNNIVLDNIKNIEIVSVKDIIIVERNAIVQT